MGVATRYAREKEGEKKRKNRKVNIILYGAQREACSRLFCLGPKNNVDSLLFPSKSEPSRRSCVSLPTLY